MMTLTMLAVVLSGSAPAPEVVTTEAAVGHPASIACAPGSAGAPEAPDRSPASRVATPRGGWTWIAEFEEQAYPYRLTGPVFASPEAARKAFEALPRTRREHLQRLRIVPVGPATR